MARNTGSDYIPTYAELAHAADEARARAKAANVKLNLYELSYTVAGFPGPLLTEKRAARSQAEAIEELKQQCSLVGWVPCGITVKLLEKGNCNG